MYKPCVKRDETPARAHGKGNGGEDEKALMKGKEKTGKQHNEEIEIGEKGETGKRGEKNGKRGIRGKGEKRDKGGSSTC